MNFARQGIADYTKRIKRCQLQKQGHDNEEIKRLYALEFYGKAVVRVGGRSYTNYEDKSQLLGGKNIMSNVKYRLLYHG